MISISARMVRSRFVQETMPSRPKLAPSGSSRRSSLPRYAPLGDHFGTGFSAARLGPVAAMSRNLAARSVLTIRRRLARSSGLLAVNSLTCRRSHFASVPGPEECHLPPSRKREPCSAVSCAEGQRPLRRTSVKYERGRDNCMGRPAPTHSVSRTKGWCNRPARPGYSPAEWVSSKRPVWAECSEQ